MIESAKQTKEILSITHKLRAVKIYVPWRPADKDTSRGWAPDFFTHHHSPERRDGGGCRCWGVLLGPLLTSARVRNSGCGIRRLIPSAENFMVLCYKIYDRLQYFSSAFPSISSSSTYRFWIHRLHRSILYSVFCCMFFFLTPNAESHAKSLPCWGVLAKQILAL
jgi:hypothetical protein